MSFRNARTRRRFSAVVAVAALTAVGAAGPMLASADTAPASGTPATVSADGLPTWQINGVVWSQVLVGNTVYATGSFTKARPPGVAAGGAGEVAALNVFAYDITTGSRVTSFVHSLNAQGRVITKSPDGSRVYVGGDFTAVDGQPRGHVAAFNTGTGALDASFHPSISSSVRSLAATSSTLYAGGNYSSVNGVARKGLSALSATNATPTPWAPTVDNGSALAMVLAPDGTRVIVGGSFTTLNGQSANGMGSLSTSGSGTGALLPWAANTTIRVGGSGSAIESLRTDGKQIYGSAFAYQTGNFEGTFAATPATGAITLVNDCHGDTYDVLPLGAVLYSVSHAHDCSWIGSFPDTSPRVRWEHALAQTIAPTRTDTGPDNYGWNYAGRPASTVLHWFPQLDTGTYTGQTQAAWSLAGNASYVAMGGEFPKVNGVAQQGLVRMAVASLAPNKRGPTYTTKPATPVPATTATSSSAGTVRVTFGTAWDYDNSSLTYDVLRDGGVTPVYSAAISSTFWTLPTKSFTDSGLTSGSSHYYQVRIRDPFGNTLLSPKSTAVTVS